VPGQIDAGLRPERGIGVQTVIDMDGAQRIIVPAAALASDQCHEQRRGIEAAAQRKAQPAWT
jgi:hypothetical protein